MRQKRLNHNKDIMLGVMALAVVVLGVVVFFWMWCFPNGTSVPGQAVGYHIVMADGFVGDSVQLMLNDSVVFDGTVVRDSQAVSVRFPEGERILMVARPEVDVVSTFELPDRGSEIILSNCDGKMKMSVKDCFK